DLGVVVFRQLVLDRGLLLADGRRGAPSPPGHGNRAPWIRVLRVTVLLPPVRLRVLPVRQLLRQLLLRLLAVLLQRLLRLLPVLLRWRLCPLGLRLPHRLAAAAGRAEPGPGLRRRLLRRHRGRLRRPLPAPEHLP